MPELFIARTQLAVRVGQYFVGLRRGREYYSERNRIGWRIVHLPFGWRAFYRMDG